MPKIRLDQGLSLHCAVDEYLWPWETPTPVLMMHGFARNATFWNRWVPPVTESRRVYRPDLLGCGGSDVPATDTMSRPSKLPPAPCGIRCHVAGAGALDRRILRRDYRPAARRGTSRTHCQPRPVQHADPHLGRNLAGFMRSAKQTPHRRSAPWRRRMVPPHARLSARSGSCEHAAAGMGRRRDGQDAARYRRCSARMFRVVDVRPLLPGSRPRCCC